MRVSIGSEHVLSLPFGMIRSILNAALRWSLVLALFSGGAASGSPASGWIELHSPHFTIITDAGEKRGREVGVRAEQMRSVFGALLLKQRLNQPGPITFLALNNDQTYYQMAPLADGKPIPLPGFLVTGEDRIYFVLNLSEPEPWRAVARDFANVLLNSNYPPAQNWFDEGLEEYFASIQTDDKTVRIGGDPELNSPDSSHSGEMVSGTGAAQKSLTELLNESAWMPLPELFAMPHDAAKITNRHTLFYAESWMLMHYLIHNNQLPEAGAYFDLAMNRHVAVDQAITQAFGMTPEKLEQAVKDYFHSLTALQNALEQTKHGGGAQAAPVVVYQSPSPVGPDDFPILTEKLAEADAQALIAGIKTRIPERRQQGLAQLHALATSSAGATKEQEKAAAPSATGNALAHRLLAADDLDHAQLDDAARELGDAAALDSRDLWIRYDLCVLKLRVAESSHKDIQGLPNMLLDLRAVLESYPDTASAYDLLAQARMAGGGGMTAMQTERSAMLLGPRNQLYPLHLAQIYAGARQWDAARALLERLKLSEDPQIAARAKEMLDQLASNQKYGMSGVAPATKNSAQPSPFDVLEQDAAKRASATAPPRAAGPLGGHDSRFLKGRLISVDCSHPPAATLAVSASGGLFKLRVPDTQRLPVIGASTFSCDWKDKSIAVNYVPGDQNDGELLSLELH